MDLTSVNIGYKVYALSLMKHTLLASVFGVFAFSCYAQSNLEWVSTTQSAVWKKNEIQAQAVNATPDVEVYLSAKFQTISGFGTCFNEKGWESLNLLSKKDKNQIFKELFSPGDGANFTICRMPLAANDFSLSWYSYNETEGDFEMKNFSIANDKRTLIPFIKSAIKYNPDLKLWASPWSPPSWMKYNKHYAMKKSKYNDLQTGQEGKEDADMFIQEEAYFKAYTLYFEKFVKAYRKKGINISMVMPQNEFVAAQVFPSCTWTAKGLGKFISYLGPQMKALNVDVFFGTMNSANDKFVDTIMHNSEINKYIKGVGLQWAGKDAMASLNKKYPMLPLYQTEQECGDGKNDWKNAVYSWSLMKQYLSNGAEAYMYWNTSLKEGGISTWGWKQNSLITVDTVTKTYKYNYEYYLMKHLSHYVKPGAKRIATEGKFDNLLAFINLDKSIAVVMFNENDQPKQVVVKIGDKQISPFLQPNSFNTFLIR